MSDKNIDQDDEYYLLDEIEFWNDYWRTKNKKKEEKIETNVPIVETLKHHRNILERLLGRLNKKKLSNVEKISLRRSEPEKLKNAPLMIIKRKK